MVNAIRFDIYVALFRTSTSLKEAASQRERQMLLDFVRDACNEKQANVATVALTDEVTQMLWQRLVALEEEVGMCLHYKCKLYQSHQQDINTQEI